MIDLQTALPSVDFGFGVGRFEDYGGPGTGFSAENITGRPFILNQAIIATDHPNFSTLIANALARTAPGFGGDGPESAIGEGLYQIATGAGFDGDGNGSNLDSGPAGDPNDPDQPRQQRRRAGLLEPRRRDRRHARRRRLPHGCPALGAPGDGHLPDSRVNRLAQNVRNMPFHSPEMPRCTNGK